MAKGQGSERILYVTDLAYPARERRYCDEDIRLTARLREEFPLALCHPRDAEALMGAYDLVVVRNSGPVLHYQEAYDAFRARARAEGVRVYNPLTGKGDMAGKGYLPELYAAGYPVIPTVDRAADLGRLPASAEYVVKPLLGADSLGLEFVGAEALAGVEFGGAGAGGAEWGGAGAGGVLVQPRVRFRYEVSFYFVDRDFQYALYAPRPERRWELERYEPGPGDLEFARSFVDWNGLAYGIQRVDACRDEDGRLLLVELEDLNPYLSLDLVDEETRERFSGAFADSMRSALG
ncbi:hypothetical protein [Streptomyces sp. FIT100]|uniref:hypothetical protein n=1 Tax=Streptomyces sp. FIT100 TaxID=2837956 RepID=UPI0021C9B912|nr:hypothetical protein [Streptomyces sp. FIT100]UUN29179.1 hypothetical protein KK483_24460 [Streptomyces sp. FIT100]